MQIEGTSAVNHQATFIKARPYILYDASLERRTLHHVLKTPLPYRIMILTEHSLARTWHIAYYQVKRKSRFLIVYGIVICHNDIRMPLLLHILHQDIRPSAVRLVAIKHTIIWQGGTKKG